MGLDMYIECAGKEMIEDPSKLPVDFRIKDPDSTIELAYFRKEHDLHGWMYNLYKAKGGEKDQEEFNCVTVQLTAQDIDNCIKDIQDYKLPPTKGFFFGDFPPNEESNACNIALLTEVRKSCLKDDVVVYYTSWW